jgi:hypothetical protein
MRMAILRGFKGPLGRGRGQFLIGFLKRKSFNGFLSGNLGEVYDDTVVLANFRC